MLYDGINCPYGKNVRFFPWRDEEKSGRQKETLMSPEIAVGGGMSFIPMEFSQS